MALHSDHIALKEFSTRLMLQINQFIFKRFFLLYLAFNALFDEEKTQNANEPQKQALLQFCYFCLPSFIEFVNTYNIWIMDARFAKNVWKKLSNWSINITAVCAHLRFT